MRGTKTSMGDEDYDAGADGDDRQAGDKPLSSKYRGVCWNRKNKRWQAAINSGGKYVYLGSFVSEYDAARAFDKAAVKLRGTRAKLNFAYSEYVDEHGNLLEDPTMKNVMYKIEAIQGGAGGGGNHKHDTGSDDAGANHDGTHGYSQSLLTLPPPSGGRGAGPANNNAQATLTPPRSQPVSKAGQQRHSHPLQHQHQQGPDGSRSAPTDWQQQQQPPRGGAGSGGLPPPGMAVDLAGPNGIDGSLFPSYPELPAPGLPGPGGALMCLPMGLPPSVSPGPGKGTPPLPGPRSRAPSSNGMLQPLPPFPPLSGGPPSASPLGHMGPGGGRPGHTFNDPIAMGQALHVMNEPPHPLSHSHGSTGPALGRPAEPSAASQRAIQRELGPGAQIMAYVPNRFTTTEEEICGVLYSEAACAQLVGSAVWTGNMLVKMGSYDTERDARQAAIKGMQLVYVFCPDEWRVNFFNSMAAKGCAGAPGVGDVGEHLRQQGANGGAPVERHPQAHTQPQPQQPQRTGMPYMRTSANGGPASTVPFSDPGRMSLPQPPAGGTAGSDGLGGAAPQPPQSQGAPQQQQPQQQPQQPTGQASMGELFQYMAGLGCKGGQADREGCQAAGGTPTLLGKRHAEDDLGAHQQHQQAEDDAKRMRSEVGRIGGVACMGGGGAASSEAHEAHKMPLAAIAKQLEQVAAGR